MTTMEASIRKITAGDWRQWATQNTTILVLTRTPSRYGEPAANLNMWSNERWTNSAVYFADAAVDIWTSDGATTPVRNLAGTAVSLMQFAKFIGVAVVQLSNEYTMDDEMLWGEFDVVELQAAMRHVGIDLPLYQS